MKSKFFVTSVTAILATSLAYGQAPAAAAAQPANAASSTQTTDKAVITKTEQPAKTETIMLPSGKKTVTTRTTTTTIKPLAGASTTKVEPAKEGGAKFGLGLGIAYTTQAQQQEDGSRSQSLEYEFAPSVSMGDYTLLGLEYYTQDLVDTSSPSWSDPFFILSRKGWALGEYFTLSPNIGFLLPTTDSSREDTGLQYQLSGNLGLSLKMTKFGLDAVRVKYTMGVARNFTDFDTHAKTNEPLTINRLRNQIDLGYQFTDALSLSTRFRLDSNSSSNGIIKNSFLMFQSLGYDISENLSVSFTHQNGGPGLDAKKDYQNNIKFYSETSSEYSIGASLSL